jgi:hypothetical protein
MSAGGPLPSATTLRSVLRGVIVACVLLASFTLRVLVSARAELRTADQYAARGDLDAALVHYRRAARWYAPGSPYHREALGKLGAMGAQAEKRGDGDLALSAYRAVRSAIMSTRSFYVPERERLRAADERIASLMAAQPPPPMDAGKSREQLRKEHLALLEADPSPSVLWSCVLLLGFFAWVGGAFAFTMRAIDAEDHFIPREALRWGAMIAVGFGLFVLGMSLA